MTHRSRVAAALTAALLSSAALAGPDYSPSKKSQYPSPNLNRADVDTLVVRGQSSTGEIPAMTVGGAPLSSLLSAVPQIVGGQLKFLNGPNLGTIGSDGKFTLTPDAMTAPSLTLTGPGLTGPVDSGTVGGTAIPAILGTKAPLASPTFSGTVTAPALTVQGAANVGSLTTQGSISAGSLTGDGANVTVGGTAIPSILGTKAPLASPTFSGTVTAPTLNVTGAAGVGSLTTSGAISAGSLAGDGAGVTVGGVAIPAILGSKAPLASPAFSGTVTAPAMSLTGPGLSGPVDSGTVGGVGIPTILGSKAPLANPAFSGTVTMPSLSLTSPGSIGDISAMSARPTGATRLRPMADKLLDFGVSVLDYGAPGGPGVGTGGDDSAAINAAIAAAVSGPTKAGKVIFPQPPSGYYNVCTAPVELSGGETSLTIEGPVGKFAGVRLLPGCTSGITSVVHQKLQTNQAARTKISNMQFDGGCKTPRVLDVEYAVNFVSEHSTYRNAGSGDGTATVRFGNGSYEIDMSSGNLIENRNDINNSCYKTISNLPDYGLQTSGTDSTYNGLIVIGAKKAYFNAANGGGNNFVAAHGWNDGRGWTTGTPDAQIPAQYCFVATGKVNIVASICDGATLAGFKVGPGPFGASAVIIGNSMIGILPAGVKGVLLEDGTNNSVVIGNSLGTVPNSETHAIFVNGALGTGNVIMANQGTAYSTPLRIRTGDASFDTAQLETFRGSARVSAQSPNLNSNLALAAKGTGAVGLEANGRPQFGAYGPADAVNSLAAIGAGAGYAPQLKATGSDPNIAAALVGKGTSGAIGNQFTLSRDPVSGDIPWGSCGDWRNTSAGTLKRVCNVNGVLKSITYQ